MDAKSVRIRINVTDPLCEVLVTWPTPGIRMSVCSTPGTAPGSCDCKLDDLLDVTAPNPSPDDRIIWNGTEWVTGPPSSGPGSGVTSIPPTTVNAFARWADAQGKTIKNSQTIEDANGDVQVFGDVIVETVLVGDPVGPRLLAGTVIPEGAVPARAGSLYLRTNGDLWSKVTGDDSTTVGWVRRLLPGDDMGGDWTNYTPIVEHMTAGNAQLTGRFVREGDLVHFSALMILGTSSVMGVSPRISLPYRAHNRTILNGYLIQALVHRPLIVETVGDWASPGIAVVDTKYPRYAGISPTVPGGWATDDQIGVTGSYETTDPR